MSMENLLPQSVVNSLELGFNTFVWASPHKPTAEQLVELTTIGTVIYMEIEQPKLYDAMLNNTLESDLSEIASDVIQYVYQKNLILVQPAGSPAFQMVLGLENAHHANAGGLELQPVMYSYTERKSVDMPQPDGSVIKRSIFRHQGWIGN